MMTRHYKVAGHTFAVSVRAELFKLMVSYKPFECEGDEPLFSLREDSGIVPKYTEVYRSREEKPCVIWGRTVSGNDVFDFLGKKESCGCLICSKDYRQGQLIMTGCYSERMIDYALKKMYALATAGKDTLLFHAVVVSCEGKGYLFLGSSGTGKSTHARLWLELVEGTELVNDDFPVVRDGMVYGSPWLCKTPCYRNVSLPIGGIVMLSQAPYNKIQRLNGIEAYQNLLKSVYWHWCRNSHTAKSLYQTVNKLVSTIPMWYLECLPNEAAARLCCKTINNKFGEYENKERTIIKKTMKLKFDIAIQEVADKFLAVAKNAETEEVAKVLTLNETGVVILRALQEGADTPAIVSQLLAEYDVSPQEAEAEVNNFIDMLKENGIA